MQLWIQLLRWVAKTKVSIQDNYRNRSWFHSFVWKTAWQRKRQTEGHTHGGGCGGGELPISSCPDACNSQERHQGLPSAWQEIKYLVIMHCSPGASRKPDLKCRVPRCQAGTLCRHPKKWLNLVCPHACPRLDFLTLPTAFFRAS